MGDAEAQTLKQGALEALTWLITATDHEGKPSPPGHQMGKERQWPAFLGRPYRSRQVADVSLCRRNAAKGWTHDLFFDLNLIGSRNPPGLWRAFLCRDAASSRLLAVEGEHLQGKIFGDLADVRTHWGHAMGIWR